MLLEIIKNDKRDYGIRVIERRCKAIKMIGQKQSSFIKNGGVSYCFRVTSNLFPFVIKEPGNFYCEYDWINWVINKSAFDFMAVKSAGCKSV